jgi:hypothetical protein
VPGAQGSTTTTSLRGAGSTTTTSP